MRQVRPPRRLKDIGLSSFVSTLCASSPLGVPLSVSSGASGYLVVLPQVAQLIGLNFFSPPALADLRLQDAGGDVDVPRPACDV